METDGTLSAQFRELRFFLAERQEGIKKAIRSDLGHVDDNDSQTSARGHSGPSGRISEDDSKRDSLKNNQSKSNCTGAGPEVWSKPILETACIRQ